MLQYTEIKNADTKMVAYLAVSHGGRRLGTIELVGFYKPGYQYFPKGKKTGGHIFPTLAECKNSLEEISCILPNVE